ncbi:hypothetical protein CDAR_37231 [Caerostris darwini]|uniref:Uncharacterized protein n=1 Tax=Caerostris darwini TaxID=1538125 RepID=A0AAV4SET9_9ARAC|nr:hypothetical protein CDAR_37231 [Caerostris darwini]
MSRGSLFLCFGNRRSQHPPWHERKGFDATIIQMSICEMNAIPITIQMVMAFLLLYHCCCFLENSSAGNFPIPGAGGEGVGDLNGQSGSFPCMFQSLIKHKSWC